jgi:hypothetical protein
VHEPPARAPEGHRRTSLNQCPATRVVYCRGVKGLRLLFATLAGIVCQGLPGRAYAASADAPGLFTFSWNAPTECPSVDQVNAEIRRLLGGEVRIRTGRDLQAEAMVQQAPFWSASLTTRQAGRIGKRFLEAPSCQSLAETTALILALMIDPDAVAATTQKPEQEPKDEQASVPAPPSAAHRSLDILVGAHAQGRLGTLPGIDVGAGAGVGVASRRWLVELRLTYGLRDGQVADSSSMVGAYGRFNITTGSLAGCFNLGRSELADLAFGPCAVVEGGVVSAEGHGASAGFSKHAAWLALGGGAYVSIALGQHLRASLEGDILVPTYRPAYVFEDLPGVVFQAPAVGGRAVTDISWRF